ncbi:MAG: hypothetical protein KDJ29_15670, partial [Hyphomicrobiales bacterium]|nr:hypothetical protein [Hyphomicrobiales bacterium]
ASSEYVLATNFPATTLATLKGRKIGITAAAVGWIEGTGATAVLAGPRTFAKGLKEKVYGGVFVAASDIVDMKLTGFSHVTRIGMGAMPGFALSFNKQRWEELPAPVRDALYSAFRDYQSHLAGAELRSPEKLFASIAGSGIKVASLGERDRKRWASGLPDIPGQWPVAIKKLQQPAVAIMRIYLDLLAQQKPPMLRAWRMREPKTKSPASGMGSKPPKAASPPASKGQ